MHTTLSNLKAHICHFIFLTFCIKLFFFLMWLPWEQLTCEWDMGTASSVYIQFDGGCIDWRRSDTWGVWWGHCTEHMQTLNWNVTILSVLCFISVVHSSLQFLISSHHGHKLGSQAFITVLCVPLNQAALLPSAACLSAFFFFFFFPL